VVRGGPASWRRQRWRTEVERRGTDCRVTRVEGSPGRPLNVKLRAWVVLPRVMETMASRRAAVQV